MKLRGISIFKPRARNKRHHPWLIEFGTKDDRTRIAGSTDYADTVKLAEKLSVIDQRVRLGIGNPAELRQELQRRIHITQHINEYERAMIAKGKSKKHALQMRLYAEDALDGVELVDQIVSSNVQIRVSKRTVSAKTKNRQMYAVMDFLRWGKKDNRWPQSIIEGISLTRLPESQITQRRVLSLHELARLIHAASNGAMVAGTSGTERALLYRTMIASGLRLGEMLRTQIKHLTADGIHLPAALTKNRNSARITLPTSLTKQLSAHVAGRPLDDPIFKVTKFNPDRLLKADLKAAGISRKTAAGVFDFHSLRHQCATILASAGAPPKAIQLHMRHSSIKLTLDTYGHLFDHDKNKAADVMAKVVSHQAQYRDMKEGEQMPEIKWSHGESNPDLLNAIQKSDHLLTLTIQGLRSKRNKPVAPRAAQRLLRRSFVRAQLAAARGGRR